MNCNLQRSLPVMALLAAQVDASLAISASAVVDLKRPLKAEIRRSYEYLDFGMSTPMGSCEGAGVTSQRGMDNLAAADILSVVLAANSFHVNRRSITADNSVLLQFLGRKKAFLDIYPSGAVALIVRKGDVDELHELEFSDTARILEILREEEVA